MLTTLSLRQIAIGFCVLTVTVLTSGVARAQGAADPATIVRSQESQSAVFAAAWLNSADPRVRAWGAYVVMRDERRELLPRLTALATAHPVVTEPPSATDHDAHYAMQSVLDAIIQFDGRLATDVAARLYPHFPVQAIILLSRADSSADPYLLNIFREESRSVGAWLTTGNLLMARKPPGFAAATLAGFTVSASVFVVDRGADRVGHGYGGSCGSGLPSPRTGWPPVGNYSIAERGVLLSRGATSTFYSRNVGGAIAPGAATVMGCAFHGTGDWRREQLLASLVGDPNGNAPVRTRVSEQIEWQNDAHYLREMSTFILNQQSLFDETLNRLSSAGLLTDAERAAVVITLDIQIIDKRRTPSVLPHIPNVASNVRIRL